MLDAHLRVCIEDFDPLGGDEQVHLGEGLGFSVTTLLQDKKTKTTWCHSVGNQSFDLKVNKAVLRSLVCLNVLVQLKFMHVVGGLQGPALV